MKNGTFPLPLNTKNNLNNVNNISYKGFRFCSELTKAGKDEDGKTKTDQDTPLISLSVGGIIGFNLFGVLDGHGVHGHFVSQFCKEYFIKNMRDYIELLKKHKGNLTAEQLYNELKKEGYNYIIELYNKSDTELASQSKFDYNMSGTTCNIVFQFDKHLVCFSVGDSRGILIFDKGNSKNEGIIALSTDHKPDLPNEYKRIQFYGGVVDKIEDMFGDKIGPARVFKAGFNYPGLAMSRSLGDLQAKECGVISTPQVIEYDINNNSKYMVICSDGVWEFITNEQVRDMGNVFYKNNDIGGFCTELIKFSVGLWEERETIRDDITVVSVFF
jgi:serine/threonine protein phosphatase PrpC